MSTSNLQSFGAAAGTPFRRWMQTTRRPISATSVFMHIGVITCVILQRFALPLGGTSQLPLSIPVFWGLTIWMLLAGRACFQLTQGLLCLLFVSSALVSTAVALNYPDSRVGFSILSLMNLLFLYIPLSVRPTDSFDGKLAMSIFLFYARICAVMGILQYGLQFAHIKVFSFGELVPALNPFLLEHAYATNSLTAYGSAVQRSNGFFLLEPSIFSQLLCVTILIEVFFRNRWRYVSLYGLAYLTSFSGTGLLTLAITLALVGLTSFRYSLRVLGIGLLVVFVAAIGAVALPDQFAQYTGRFGEIGSDQSSGYHRFISPFIQVAEFADGPRFLIGYGPGSTMRSIYFTEGTGNTASQLLIDYGLITGLIFVAYLLTSVWSKRFAALSLLLVITFELGGDYLLTGSYVLMMALLGVWMASSNMTGEGNTVQSPRSLAVR